eukprot:SAG11_NODE_122_length_15816_cov_4.209327_10_plen_492_part_00
MANFLKLNKSYLGPEVLSNGSFDEYGPELVINGDFASNTWWTVETPDAEISNDKVNFDTTGENFGIYRNSFFTTGKQYKVVFTIDTYTSGGVHLNIGGLPVNSYSSIGTYTAIVVGNGSNVFGIQSQNGGAILSINNVSVTESGAVELVDNGQFIGVANGTDVTTLSQWSTNNLSSADIQSNVLQAISSSGGQLVKLTIPTVINTEYKFNVDSVTGDLADNSISIWNVNGSAAVDIDVTSGSGSLTFVADTTSTQVNFFAGNRSGVKQTNYANISMQATNQFAYGYERFGTDNAGGQNSVFDLQAKTVRFIAATLGFNHIAVSGNSTTTNQEYLLKIDVESIVGTSDFVWYNGSGYYRIKLNVGENEFRYTRQGTNNAIYFGIDVSSSADIGSSITLNSISLQEVVNQPKLIGVDNVSTVSAPTDNTVVINNGLTDGADTLTITYAGASASSSVQMRNFFQDSIIRLANSNNTAEVLEITPPVLITDIVAS